MPCTKPINVYDCDATSGIQEMSCSYPGNTPSFGPNLTSANRALNIIKSVSLIATPALIFHSLAVAMASSLFPYSALLLLLFYFIFSHGSIR